MAGEPPTDAGNRRRAAAVAGHKGDANAAREALTDTDPSIRATALGALLRAEALTQEDVAKAITDEHPAVRRRAAEVVAAAPAEVRVPLKQLLGDQDATVVETAAWASGELEPPEPGVVAILCELTTGHEDPLVREAAVAALGAIGDEAGLAAILKATSDKATVRRRAVIALAPFEGKEVEEALARARQDRDWQVRQAAEDLS